VPLSQSSYAKGGGCRDYREGPFYRMGGNMDQAANKLTNPDAAATKPEATAGDRVLKKIKSAWIAGLISASLTLVFVLIALAGKSFLGIDAWGLIDVVVMAGLSYGVFRRSRTCALFLLGFFLLNKLLMWSEAETASGVPMALVVLWFFGQGIIGTFQYHRLQSSPDSTRP
jgi:hypothetical protein